MGGGTVQITIADDTGVVEEKTFPPAFALKKASYSFTDGEHGRAYSVTVTTESKDGSTAEPFEKRLLFLEDAQLPELPLLTVETADGQDPAFEEAEMPAEEREFCKGATITGEYVKAVLAVTRAQDADLTAQARIRVRGNGSAVYVEKKPYKLYLDEPADLLGLGGGYAGREWILLNASEPLNTYTGTFVATLCGVEWQPQMRFVNLVLNGDWKGLYALIQPVDRQTAGTFISDDGLIFESDLYWWAPGQIHFETEYQSPYFGFTFKYPEVTRQEDARLLTLQRHLQELENYLLSNDPRYNDYLDTDSFANWILAQDILNQRDGMGTNKYFYKYDFDKNDLLSSKIKMGPLWDFDHILSRDDDWSRSRCWRPFIPDLLEQPSFRDLYSEKWEAVSADLYTRIDAQYSELYRSEGEALEASLQLDARRWGLHSDPLRQQLNDALDWFGWRIDWINAKLQEEAENGYAPYRIDWV